MKTHFLGQEKSENSKRTLDYLLCFRRKDGERGYLQLSGGHLEDELHHGADGEAGRAGGVDLVPDGVAVHLKDQRSRELAPRSHSFILCHSGVSTYPHPSAREPHKHGSDRTWRTGDGC